MWGVSLLQLLGFFVASQFANFCECMALIQVLILDILCASVLLHNSANPCHFGTLS